MLRNTIKEIKYLSSVEPNEKFATSHDDVVDSFMELIEKNSLDISRKDIKKIVKESVKFIMELKYHYNRPRPYQVAEELGIDFDRFVSDTAKTPAFPSGRTVQPIVVAEYYAKKYPQHRAGLMKGAKICGYGRVIAGMHYPSDYDAGVKLGEGLIDFLNMGLKEDAPVNSTGGGISMPPTMKKKKKKKDEVLKRF